MSLTAKLSIGTLVFAILSIFFKPLLFVGFGVLISSIVSKFHRS